MAVTVVVAAPTMAVTVVVAAPTMAVVMMAAVETEIPATQTAIPATAKVMVLRKAKATKAMAKVEMASGKKF
jgi:hypothetical protein